MTRIRSVDVLLLLIYLCLSHTSPSLGAPTPAQVRAAMKRATDFMMNTVSNRGGFVWKYSLDLEEKYGELKARDSMIWVEPPGTPTVGLMLIEAYKATGDRQYLEYADRVAGALIWGQLPSGGWHYFIDFDMPGLQRYYDTFFSRCWGWQEYLHFYGNGTFDDRTTAAATLFLLSLYDATLDPKYRPPLLKALTFICEAQYPNGAWPQRYPLKNEFAKDGHRDYTSCYTFNDGVISSCIDVLLEAHRALGVDAYRKAARRGMDFYILSQLPRPQAGWAQQYDEDMKPAWGRPFEVNAVCAGQTSQNVSDLMRFYKITGDRRYLEPIPKALDWLDAARFGGEPTGTWTHTCFYELGTNRPVYMRRVGKTYKDIRFVKTYDPKGAYPYGVRVHIDVAALRKAYDRVRELTPAQARAEYEEERRRRGPVINRITARVDYRTTAVDAAEIETLIQSLDERGGWVVDNEVLDVVDFQATPPHVFAGYDTGTYVTRMYRLIGYLGTIRAEVP